MQGQILVFNEQKQAGAIAATDGKRYLFHINDWEDLVSPERGMFVEFVCSEENRARQVLLAMPDAPQQPQPAPARAPAPMPAAAPRQQAQAAHQAQPASQTPYIQQPMPQAPMPTGQVPFAQAPKRKSVLTLLAWFLGVCGGHRFYLGAWGWGLVQLLGIPTFLTIVMVLFAPLGFLLWMAYIIFPVVETTRYILMTDAEFDAKMAAYQARNPGPFSFFW